PCVLPPAVPAGGVRSAPTVRLHGSAQAEYYQITPAPGRRRRSSEGSMEFVLTPEQIELRDSLRRFLEARSPETEVRRLMATTEGYDKDVWARLTAELGLTALLVPEEYGGLGLTFLE